MSAKAIDIGTIELSEKVFVSDPCYDTDTWCTVRMKDVVPGTYHCRVRMLKDPLSVCGTKRVKELIIVHESIKDWKKSLKWEYAGNAGVDSGQMGIYDYDHFDKLNKVEETKDNWYDIVCKITLNEDAGIADTHSAVCSSGYGDGSYPVYGNWLKDKLRAIKVVFI